MSWDAFKAATAATANGPHDDCDYDYDLSAASPLPDGHYEGSYAGSYAGAGSVGGGGGVDGGFVGAEDVGGDDDASFVPEPCRPPESPAALARLAAPRRTSR